MCLQSKLMGGLGGAAALFSNRSSSGLVLQIDLFIFFYYAGKKNKKHSHEFFRKKVPNIPMFMFLQALRRTLPSFCFVVFRMLRANKKPEEFSAQT